MSHVIAVRISEGEWTLFQHMMSHHNVTAQAMLHAIIVDALVDEGYDVVRCQQQEGRSILREASEARSPTAEGSYNGHNVSSPGPEVDGGNIRTLPLLPNQLQRRSSEDGLHGGPEGSGDNAA